jgi:hypothetical protein
MTTNAANLGYSMGWNDAERYVRGTKADRRAIRRRLAKDTLSGADFWCEYHRAVYSRLEAFADAIREGRLARTIDPIKVYRVVNRGT